MARATDCTDPDQVLNSNPCLNCLSIHQLWAALTGLLANGNGNAGDLDALKAGADKFRNLSEKEFLIGLISTLPDSFWSGLTLEEVGQDFGCMNCWSDADIKAVFLTQWCEYWSSYAPD